MQFFKKYHQAFLLLAFAAVLIVWIFDNAPEPLKSVKIIKIPKIPFVQVKVASQSIPVFSRGRVYPAQVRKITSEVPGLVIHVSGDLIKGAQVKKNDLLIQLDQQPFILAIAQKQASLDQAKLQWVQIQAKARVAQKGVGETASEYARHIPQLRYAKSQMEAGQAALSYAQSQLEKATIKAPIDGKVIELHITEGEYIRATSAIAKIYGTKMVEVRLPLNDRQIDILGIHYGEQFNRLAGTESLVNPKVNLRSYQDKHNSWFGTITRIEGERDKNQLLYVIAQVPGQGNLQATNKPLLPGSFVEASIYGKVIKDLIIIPRKAEHSNNKVWVINQDNTLLSKDVTVMYRGKDMVYVSAGLFEKDRVVTAYFHLMTEGLLVEPWTPIAKQAHVSLLPTLSQQP